MTMISRYHRRFRLSRSRIRAFGLAGLCALSALASAAAPAAAAASSTTDVIEAAVAAIPSVPVKLLSTLAPKLGTPAPAKQLDSAVQGWIGALSQEKPFAEWKHATHSTEALGPGTHGWLVTMRLANGRPVGYMVVYAAADGTYQLGEYGAGPQPLFDAAALSRSLVANGLISGSTPAFKAEKLYLHPFAAVWRVQVDGQTYWLDAKTDEMLPLDDERWDMLVQQSSEGAAASATPAPPALAKPGGKATVAAIRINASFDPFERLSWLMNEKPFSVQNEAALLQWLQKSKQLRYISEPFGDRMLYALAVIGYERWSGGRIDVALDNEGVRFIPLATLREAGLFYK